MVNNGVSQFTGLDYWTGLLDWTTGLKLFFKKCLPDCTWSEFVRPSFIQAAIAPDNLIGVN